MSVVSVSLWTFSGNGATQPSICHFWSVDFECAHGHAQLEKPYLWQKKFINYLLKFESGYHPGIIKERWLSWVQLISDLTHLFWLKYLQLWQLISRNKSKVCTAKHMQIMYCVFIKWKHFESTLCPSQCSWSRMEQIKTKVFKTMPKIVVSS